MQHGQFDPSDLGDCLRLSAHALRTTENGRRSNQRVRVIHRLPEVKEVDGNWKSPPRALAGLAASHRLYTGGRGLTLASCACTVFQISTEAYEVKKKSPDAFASGPFRFSHNELAIYVFDTSKMPWVLMTIRLSSKRWKL